jgi:hypothetical protein
MVDLVSAATGGTKTSESVKREALARVGLERTPSGGFQGISQRAPTTTTTRRGRSRSTTSTPLPQPMTTRETPTDIITATEAKRQAKTLAEQVQEKQISTRDTPNVGATTLAKQRELQDIARRPSVTGTGALSPEERISGIDQPRRTLTPSGFSKVLEAQEVVTDIPEQIQPVSDRRLEVFGGKGRVKRVSELFSQSGVPQIGTPTPQFAGTIEGVAQFVESPTKTFGQLQVEQDIVGLGIQEEFKKSIQKEFKAQSDPLIKSRFEAFQSEVDKGKLSQERAQKLFESDISNIQSNILSSKKIKDIEKEFSLEESGVGAVPGVFQEIKPGRRIPIISPIKELQEIGVGEKIQTVFAVEDTLGERVSRKGVTNAAAQSILPTVELIGDVGIVTGIGQLAGTGVRAGRTAISRNIERQLARDLTGLGEARLGGIRPFETSTGQFGFAGQQRSGSLTRDITLRGTPQEIGGGLSIIPESAGFAETFGTIRPTFTKGPLPKLRTAIARAVTKPTEFRALQEFTIDSVSVGKQFEPIAGGVIPQTGSGIGVFTPGRKLSGFVKDGVADLTLTEGGRIVTVPTRTTAFTKQFGDRQFGIGISERATVLDIGIKPPKGFSQSESVAALKSNGKGVRSVLKTEQVPKEIGQLGEVVQAGLKEQTIIQPFKSPRTPRVSQTGLIFETTKAPKVKTSIASVVRVPAISQAVGIGILTGARTGAILLRGQLAGTKSLIGTSQLSTQAQLSPQKTLSSQRVSSTNIIDTFSPSGQIPVPTTFTIGAVAGGFGFPIGLPRLPTLRGRNGRKRGGGEFTQRIRPSLTGIGVFELGGITGDLPATGGIATRFVPKEFSKVQKGSRRRSRRLTEF